MIWGKSPQESEESWSVCKIESNKSALLGQKEASNKSATYISCKYKEQIVSGHHFHDVNGIGISSGCMSVYA